MSEDLQRSGAQKFPPPSYVPATPPLPPTSPQTPPRAAPQPISPPPTHQPYGAPSFDAPESRPTGPSVWATLFLPPGSFPPPASPPTPVDTTPDLTDIWLDIWPAPTEPAEPWRHRILRGVVPTLVLVLITAGLGVVAHRAYGADPPRDTTYLPAAGTYSRITLDGSQGQLEQSIELAGALEYGSLSSAELYGQDLKKFLPNNELWVAEANTGGTDPQQLQLVFNVGRTSVGLVGINSAADTVGFSPALPVSSGRERGSRTTTASGAVIAAGMKPDGTYTASISVTGSGGCINWSADVSANVSAGGAVRFGLRACSQAGVTSFSFQRGSGAVTQLRTTTTDTVPAGQFGGSLTVGSLTKQQVSGWKPSSVQLIHPEGTAVTPWDGTAKLNPVPYGDHQLAIATIADSITSFSVPASGSATTATEDWVGFPGGRISQLLSAGNLVIAVTDQRKVVAYDSTGLRIWQHQFNDLVANATVNGDRLVLSVFSGSVQSLDLRTGRTVWQRNVNSVRSTGIAANNQIVAFGEDNDAVGMLDANSGRFIESDASGAVNGIGVAGTDALELRTARLDVRRTTGNRGVHLINTGAGGVPKLASAGGLAVVSGTAAVAVIQPESGIVAARLPVAATLASGADSVALVYPNQVLVITGDDPAGLAQPIPAVQGLAFAGIASWGAVLIRGTAVEVIE